MKDITYNKDILAVLNDISKSLTKEFIIRKIDDKLSIKVNEKSLSILVDFSTPVNSFDFESETIAFAEGVFADFYKFFNLFDKPSLKQDANKLILKEGKQTIKFSPSNPEIIKNEFKSVKKLPDLTASISVTREQFKSISKMINMLDAGEVQFLGNGKILNIVIGNDASENETTLSFDLENELDKEVNISLNTLVFKNAPDLDYTINIFEKANLFNFVSVNENFTLNLFTGMKIA